MTTLNTKIKFRNDLSVNWETLNPILLKGEPGYDTQKKIFKVGDGVTPWNALESIAAERESEITTYNYPYPGGTLTDGVAVNENPNKAIADTDIIWALGTNFGTTTFSNPIDGTRIIQTNSGISWGLEVSNVTNRTQSGAGNYYNSSNLSQSWFRLNFGSTRKVRITKIALQQRGAFNDTFHRSLRISYSDDGVTFNTAINLVANNGFLQWSLFDVSNYIESQYLEIKHTSPASTGAQFPDMFTVGEILLWGSIY